MEFRCQSPPRSTETRIIYQCIFYLLQPILFKVTLYGVSSSTMENCSFMCMNWSQKTSSNVMLFVKSVKIKWLQLVGEQCSWESAVHLSWETYLRFSASLLVSQRCRSSFELVSSTHLYCVVNVSDPTQECSFCILTLTGELSSHTKHTRLMSGNKTTLMINIIIKTWSKSAWTHVKSVIQIKSEMLQWLQWWVQNLSGSVWCEQQNDVECTFTSRPH